MENTLNTPSKTTANPTKTKERILVIAHGHPDFSKGGGEIAAYNLFLEYKRREDCEAMFMARVESGDHGGTSFGMRNESEVLFFSNMSDFFICTQGNKAAIWNDFRDFLNYFKPTIVHFHHYIHLGIEMLREVRNYSKDVKIVLTLHEYMAICFNSGQMIKTDGKLCYKSSPMDCHNCFPNIHSTMFLLRESYFKSFFEVVDLFISPSKFLIDRYKTWGLPEEKMVFVENGQPIVDEVVYRKVEKGAPRNRFAYFGQLNPFKGIDVLLEAIMLLPDKIKDEIHVDIHGANLDKQTSVFQEKIKLLLEELDGVVVNNGPYEPHEMGKIINETDWVIMPSIWWENSPMVIQEAFNHGRPIIASDIGGMAEKIQDGVNGLLFRNKKPLDLAHKIEKAFKEVDLYNKLVAGIKKPMNVVECANIHFELYGKIKKQPE